MKASAMHNPQHMQTATQVREPGSVRHFKPADLPRIADICKNVYGGTDVLHRTIEQQLQHNPAATVLVADTATSQQVQGVVCSEVRGSVSYLFGLRVAEEARGKGVASHIMAAICHHSCSHNQVQHIVTTTIPPNTPAVRVITRLGFTHSSTVDRWPQEHLQAGYEAAVGFRPNKEQPHQPVEFAPQQPHMLDHIPGAREVISRTSGGVQPSDWLRCRSVQQLQQAVASIRQQQQQQQEGPWQQPEGVFSPPLDWLPWVYEVYPLQSDWVQQRLAAGDIWLLPQPHPAGPCQHNTAYAAVVVLAHSELNYRTCAGVVAGQESGVAAALGFVGSRVPHFVAYIDSGSRHSSGAVEPQLQLPPVLDLGRQQLGLRDYMCFLVYAREANTHGLPDVASKL